MYIGAMELITHENMKFSVSRHDSTERKRGWTQKGDKNVAEGEDPSATKRLFAAPAPISAG
jgi:hypothetical protein